MSAIFFSLSNQVDQTKFLKQVQKLIFKQDSLENKFLKIEIVSISQESDYTAKLEHKNDT